VTATLDFDLYDAQADFVECQDRFTAFIGGIGSGKSYAGAVRGLVASARPKTLGLVVSPTYPMLRDATLRTYVDVFGEAWAGFNKAEMLATIRNGAEILFRSADNPDRLRGPNLHWCHIDEGALCHRQTWDILIGRLRADGQAGPCWITTTPKGRNWLWERRDQLRIFQATTRDNPYLSPEFVASLERAYTGDFAAQELGGQFVAFEGLIYAEFNRDVHMSRREAAEFARIVVGVDEGYTNPAVALVIGVDGDDRAHVLEEFYQRQVLQGDFVATCAERHKRYGVEAFWVDPSAAGLIAAMAQARLPVRPADNAVTDGIQAVKARLALQGDGRPRLTLDPSCVRTASEFESYVWAKTRDGQSLDKPVKENDHAMDAIRYTASALAHKRIGYKAW